MAFDFNSYLSPFTWRYGSDEMRFLWSEVHKRSLWREVWAALAQAESDYGLVTPEQVQHLRARVREIDVERALEIEAQIHHDLMAELKAYAEQAPDAKRILHLGATSADIEDIAQEVFIRIFRFIKKYRGEASFESWVYKIVLNYCRSYARRRSMLNRIFFVPVEREEDEKSVDIIGDQPQPDANPMMLVENRRIADDILGELRRLPPIYKDILIMREVNELSYEEIAEILGISIGTVKSRISRARSIIRDKVKL